MEKSNKIERSEAWNNIYEVLARLDLKENTGDCLDRPSAATELEQLFLKLLPIQNVVGSAFTEITKPYIEDADTIDVDGGIYVVAGRVSKCYIPNEDLDDVIHIAN